MAEVHVPHDVLWNHILPRVPPKSIGRFRCVSKEWHSLLTSDMFQNKHIDHHQDNIKLMLFSKTETSSFGFTTIDCEAPPVGDEGLAPTRRPLPQFGDTTPPCDIRALTSFHGLVCLGIKTDRCYGYSDLILWNPVTNEFKRLSKAGFHLEHTNSTIFALYYSSSEDDYKLLSVRIFDDNDYIYSLKSDSWRKVDTFKSAHILSRWNLSRGTYWNENLYFLQHHEDNRPLPSIIKFETKTERLSLIETPNVDEAYDYFATIVVKSDCIHVCVKYDIHNGIGTTTHIELWKLNEYENLEKVLTYQPRPMRLQHVSNIRFISLVDPFYLMKNGNWLMKKKYSCYYEHKFYKVYLNDVDDSDYDAMEVKVDGKYNIVLEEGRYIETFVSPNRYMK